MGFDIREKQGSIFTLLQGSHHDHIGMITISETLQQTLSNFISNLNAIQRELIKTTGTQGQHNFMVRSVILLIKRLFMFASIFS